MKILLYAALTLFLLSSCKEKNDPEIFGTWTFLHREYVIESNNDSIAMLIKEAKRIAEMNDTKVHSFTFDADGSFEEHIDFSDERASAKATNDEVALRYLESISEYGGSYTYKDKHLMTDYDHVPSFGVGYDSYVKYDVEIFGDTLITYLRHPQVDEISGLKLKDSYRSQYPDLEVYDECRKSYYVRSK